MREHDRDARNVTDHRWNETWQNRRWNGERDETWWTRSYRSLHDNGWAGWAGRRRDHGYREEGESYTGGRFYPHGWYSQRWDRRPEPWLDERHDRPRALLGRGDWGGEGRYRDESWPWQREGQLGWNERREASLWDQTKREVRDTWDRLRGSFSARGPRGYLRPDERIREDVYERLAWHLDSNAHRIEVIVRGGEITLTGDVSDRRIKRLAEDIVEDVPGVRQVSNRLRVEGRWLPIAMA